MLYSILRNRSMAGALCSVVVASSAFGQIDSVSASGPGVGTTLEDRVEVVWTTAAPPAVASTFVIGRKNLLFPASDTVSVGVVASSVNLYDDFSAVPGLEYAYCVYLRPASGPQSLIGCDNGARAIARPTGFTASDGLHEDRVALSWSDRSEIEDGYNIYRDAGNTLNFDGTDDHVRVPGTTTLPSSFTVEFWAARGLTGGNQYIVNLENSPQGSPTTFDLEIGFNTDNRFVVAFGSNLLVTAAAYTDSNWHHWAVTYDEGSRERTIYRDGVEVGSGVYFQPFASVGALEFGRRSSIGNANNRGYFRGSVDEVRIWSSDLSAGQIPPLMTEMLLGTEPDLFGQWPMDVAAGNAVPDVIGTHSGTVFDANADGNNWTVSGVPDYHRQIGANLTSANDRTAVPGFQSYEYRLAAFEDVNGNGVFDPGTDFESQERNDTGWRAVLSPPGDVMATDGQLLDRVRITWVDLSDSESSFNIYRNGGLIGTVPADSTLYDDFAATSTHNYCVAASNGVESIQVCDQGKVGGLAPPDSVAATDRIFDDRVLVTWLDTTDTEDGFEVFRDGVKIGTTGPDAEEFGDFTVQAEEENPYCVRAFSNADPENPSYSAYACTVSPGAKAAVLPPADVAATDDEFEDRVQLTWTNPSATAMLFKVYRNNVLVEVLDFTMRLAVDSGIPSDTDLDYCVSSETVVAPASSIVTQGRVSQILESIRHEDAVSANGGGEPTSPETALATIYQSLGLNTLSKGGITTIEGIVESAKVCDMGRRSLLGPTEVEATDNEHERHVQIDWTDNSGAERGYYVFREGPVGGPIPLDTLSANRTTYGDYTGVPGVQYDYTVEAFDLFDTSSSDHDQGIRTLKPPSGLQASDGASERYITVDWNDNSDAESGYNIYRWVAGGPDTLMVGMAGTNEEAYTDTIPTILLGSSFKYFVATFDEYGESVRAADVGSTMLEAPENVSASDSYLDRVSIVWVDRSEVEEQYRLYRRPIGAPSPDLEIPLSANVTKYVDNTAAQNAQYEYCVRALLAGGSVTSQATCDRGGRLGAGSLPAAGLTALKINSHVHRGYVNRNVEFGRSVALDGQDLLIGMPGFPWGFDLLPDLVNFSVERWGAVVRWRFTPMPSDKPNEWQKVPQGFGGVMVPFDQLNLFNGDFGHAIDVESGHLVIGDPFFGTSQPGNNYSGFSTWEAVSPTPTDDWVKTREKFDNLGSVESQLGISVGVADGFVIMGDNLDNDGGTLPDHNGSAFVCDREEAPTPCVTRANLVNALDPSYRAENAEFGWSSDITRVGNTLYAIVGMPGRDISWLFECNAGSNACTSDGHWSVKMALNTRFVPGQAFGHAVAITPDIAIVTSQEAQGMVVYERDGTNWNERVIYSPTQNIEGFGVSVAISDTTIIVGAPREEIAEHESAGAVYVFEYSPANQSLSKPVRYDARVAGDAFGSPGIVRAGARFGRSVDVANGWYAVGAPGDDEDLGHPGANGAVYLIPVGLEPPQHVITPADVELLAAENIRASDGTAKDRIQVRWEDNSNGEQGHYVYRTDDAGQMEILGEVGPDIRFYDDFEASPGDAYNYCVAAFYQDQVTERICDAGWRPPNGTIAGRIAGREGGGTEEALVCLDPNPSKGMLFDGDGGYLTAPVADDIDLFADFTIEAWIKPYTVSGTRYIVSKDSAWALAIDNGHLRLALFENTTTGVTATGGPPMAEGQWYHVAVSMDKDRNVTFYRDGLENSGYLVSAFANPLGDTLTVGQRGDNTGFFEGVVDEIRLWRTIRTTSQIQNARFEALEENEENLAGYWPVDQGQRRIAPDVSEEAHHAFLIGGAYLADEGAPLNTCVSTVDEGNYSFAGIRYGLSTEFHVIPSKQGRAFEPSFKKITLSTDSPVQNEVAFTDVTSYTVAGAIRFLDVIGSDSLLCPVPGVKIHLDKSGVATDQNVKTTSRGDGTYRMGVDPSLDDQDPWFVIPRLVDPNDGELVHAFDPPMLELIVTDDTFDNDFNDLTRYTLSGHFSGGDPGTCGRDIGRAVVRVYTQDGCYSVVDTVDSGVDNGAFAFELPPLPYLMEVVEVLDAPGEREDEIKEFFENLGTVEVNMRGGDVERNLIYRAPLMLSVEGLDPLTCPGDQITQRDEEGNVLRSLPEVASIGAFEFVPLTIRVREDYGNGQFCDVDEGRVSIFDGIADNGDVDSTMALEDGKVDYSTFGASPNIFSGARIQGVDRSFQKPITFIAQVEGRPPLLETQWAIVEGARERASTFVSATTEEFPLMIIHDPPGSNSFASIEAGSSMCTSISNTRLKSEATGADVELSFGFTQGLFSGGVGLGVVVETGAGFKITTGFRAGREQGSLWGSRPNREICVSTTEGWSTSDDMTWVGEDIHVGVALNLIFAIADVLDLEAASCQLNLAETLAADLDQSDPFGTTYVFGTSHIALTLIPELEHLIALNGGDATLEGTVNGVKTKVRLSEALENWKKQLANNDRLEAQALANPDVNRSFSGGTETSYSETQDTTTVTKFESTRLYLDAEGSAGGVTNLFGFEQGAAAVFELHSEWVSETQDTQGGSKTIGYVLKDGDTGDYFSVDVAKDPRYKTFVFGTVSGRSSNPHEANTQARDNPIISVDPPVQYNVDPEDAAVVQLTLINASESHERRRYAVAIPGETNPGNLGIAITGDGAGSERAESFLIDPGKAITVNISAEASPGVFAYKNVAAVLYPQTEYDIWLADVRQPFVLSDTAWFSIYFDSTGGSALAAAMDVGWNWFSLNREGGDVNRVLERLDAHDGDIIRSQNAESRYDAASEWTGSLSTLKPGEGYRIKLKESTVFRIDGEAVESANPIDLKSGWNWVGYLPKRRMPINQALASLGSRARPGDIIVGQSTFAQYVDRLGWVGTLQTMEPGESYAVNLTADAKLQYPGLDAKPDPTSLRTRRLTTQGPQWEVDPGKFDGAMTMVVEVQMDGLPFEQTATRVAVFAGDSLRGIGDVDYIESLDKHLAFVMIYGLTAEENEEELRVHVYDGERDKVYEDVGSISYLTQSMVGRPDEPAVLELTMAGKAPQLVELPDAFALHGNYPNPFNPTTTIAYDLPSAVHVNLTVYDVLGRRVMTLVDSEHRAGRHKVLFDATQFASGFYVYRIQAGDFKEVRKMVLVK